MAHVSTTISQLHKATAFHFLTSKLQWGVGLAKVNKLTIKEMHVWAEDGKEEVEARESGR